MREEHGKKVIAIRTIEKIKSDPAEFVVIDGIRSPQEVELFREHFDLVVLAITAPTEKRHKWILERKRKDDSSSLKDIQARDAREIGFGVKKVIQNANYVIENDGSKEDLREKCKNTFKSIINS